MHNNTITKYCSKISMQICKKTYAYININGKYICIRHRYISKTGYNRSNKDILLIEKFKHQKSKYISNCTMYNI